MLVQNVDGLIIDQRLNYGGTWQYQQGFSLLYNNTFKLCGYDQRGPDPNNHLQMVPYTWVDQFLTTQGDPMTLFDRPIAVLTGPVSTSGGDVSALTIKSHPMARLFGKPTNGAFSTYPGEYNLGGNADWIMSHTNSNCYLLDDPGNYLAHKAFIPDEEVWFTPDDAANGVDAVVAAAIQWINNLSYSHNVRVNATYVQPATEEVTIIAEVENPNDHDITVSAYISINDSTCVDTLELTQQGAEGDSLWGVSWMSLEENTFHVSVKTVDPADGTHRTIPNVAHFATIGPLVIEDYYFLYGDTIPNHGDQLFMKLDIKNEGAANAATDVSTILTPLDTNTRIMITSNNNFGDILPGETVTMPGYYIIRSNNVEPDSVYANLKVEIKSEGYTFWTDTISVFMTEPVGISVNNQGIPDVLHFDRSQE